MRVKLRIRPENESQKCYILTFDGTFGKTSVETFLTDKEAAAYVSTGVMCVKKE